MSDHRGAAMMLPALPPARELLADRGYDSNRFRVGLAARGIVPCIPSTKSRKEPLSYDKLLYRQRYRIENMFGRLKNWRRVATRYDRCAHTFFSAIRIAITRCAGSSPLERKDRPGRLCLEGLDGGRQRKLDVFAFE